jgi:hypothetical protein
MGIIQAFKGRKCGIKYASAYAAAYEAFNHIGRWDFFKCRKCKAWHIKQK